MRRWLAIAVIEIASANVMAAQRAGRALEGGRPQRGVARGQPANRAGLEQQLRQRFAQRVRVELGLAPDQMARLADVNRRFGQQQRALDQREMQTRQGLRQALIEAPSDDREKRVADLPEQVMKMQRQRPDLIAAAQPTPPGLFPPLPPLPSHTLLTT